MAYAKPYGQPQGASPWSAGVPPGIQQHQQAGQPPMFNQPMGAFDLSGGWQGQQQGAHQWIPAMQQVQFVPSPAFMQQQQPPLPPQQHQSPHMRQQQLQQQQQRPMQQRSLSAPRVGNAGFNKRPMNNQNNSGQQNWQQRQQHNNNNNNQYQQRNPRQQSRMNNNHTNNSNNNNNNNNNQRGQANNSNSGSASKQQGQNQQQASKKGVVKVTKVKKQLALKAKQGVKVASSNNDNAPAPAAPAANPTASNESSSKPQSKTAERKQLKLQARKNAETLKQSKLPVSKGSGKAAGPNAVKDDDTDEPIDQAQLKCVPAVFGFVCKLCDVFLRDKVARREHIDSDDHMQKFKAHEEELKQQQSTQQIKQEAEASEVEQEPTVKDEQAEPSSDKVETEESTT